MSGTHDTYITAAPEELRPLLIRLRALLKGILPDAEEVIAYKMPGLSIEGSVVAKLALASRRAMKT